jgi:hypothetical protein
LPPIEELRDAFLYNVLPPLLAAAVLMAVLTLVGWLAKQREVAAQLGSVLGVAAGMTLACAVGTLLVAHYADKPELAGDGTLNSVLESQPLPLTHWPRPAREWLPWVMLAALLTSAIAHQPGVSGGVGWALRGSVAAHAGWLLAPDGLREQYFWAPLLFGAVVLVEWAVLEQFPWRRLMPLVAAVVAVVASMILIYGASLSLNQEALILAGSLTGVGLVALALRVPASAVSAAVAVMVPGLLLAGGHGNPTAVPAASFVLTALAPLALAPSLLPAWQRRQKKGLWAVQLILLLLPLVVAVVLAAQNESLDYE